MGLPVPPGPWGSLHPLTSDAALIMVALTLSSACLPDPQGSACPVTSDIVAIPQLWGCCTPHPGPRDS